MEWRLGWGILKTAMEGYADGSASEVAKLVAKRLRTDEGPFVSVFHANVACFTESPNLEATRERFHYLEKTELIDFDVNKHLVPALQRGPHRKLGIRLWPVVYSIDYLLDVASKLIGEVVERIEAQGEQNHNLIVSSLANRAFFALRTPFTLMGLSYKRPKFQVEAEWRIIATGMLPLGVAEAGPPSPLDDHVEIPINGLEPTQ